MVESNAWSVRILGPSLVASGLLVACSSSDGSSPPPVDPFDSGTVVVPEASSPVMSTTVQVQGQGAVESGDAHVADGGMVGQVVCSVGGGASQCTAIQGTTLYAIPAVGWVLSRWTTTGLAPGIDLGNGATDYTVTAATPSPLLVVFGPQSNGIPPADAGLAD